VNRGCAILLLVLACSQGRGAPPAPGVHLLPEEAWLYAQLPSGTWSAEIEEEGVVQVPSTDQLRLQITQPLAEFRVRLIDGRGQAVPHRGAVGLHAPTGQQLHTLQLERPLEPGAYRIVIDAPLGGVLRDARGRRFRGQRFRLQVHPPGDL
jgi:hypothetical protein